jgi:wobble nucleotide-excising tRNase
VIREGETKLENLESEYKKQKNELNILENQGKMMESDLKNAETELKEVYYVMICYVTICVLW